MIRQRFLKLFTYLLFLIISLILYKKFNQYYSQNDFAKLGLIIILFINFLIGSFIKSFTKYSFIFFIYFFLILYSLNSLIVYVDYNNLPQKKIEKKLKAEDKKYDKRKLIEVVKDERLKGNDIYPYVVPREFLKFNKKEIPLTPISNTNYVACNEFGVWKKIKTDKFGFNNEKFINSFDILLMGDSFAEGSCVDQLNEPANLFLKNHNLNTYNIGVSGNGPLLSLALAHEIKEIVDFKYIVWFIFDNDFYDITLETKSDYLNEYLKKDFIKNNYFSNIEIQNNIQKKYIEKNLESFKSGFSLKESLFELKPLIYRINKLINKKGNEDLTNYDKKDFKKIFDKMLYLYKDKGIFVVYLPETTCFKIRSKECTRRFDELKSLSNEIIFLNFFEFLKRTTNDYKKMYALGQDRAHFSDLGYKYLVEFVNKSIENK